MSLSKKSIHEQFQEITSQIKQLEQMVQENTKKAKELHNRNSHLRETIKALKEKRTEIIFADQHIRE